ncbi:hypothetical protein [Ammoniphilus sp. YIM 78166]|uniref:TOTE conflict system archaeo-eukaryotic primase domain-containing protein n=1 Tax=Ammoniphilus sp. YIM 78166 TaxID=1644106 RepID=UPI001F0E5B97|nr:hypothetical protein [Ammoniphilus sp. YIM 78166]
MKQEQREQAYRHLQYENDKLRREIQRLKTRLAIYEPVDQKDLWATPAEVVQEESQSAYQTLKEKIALFRRLFQGRTDVFAKRWESKEKAGYIFACANDGVRPLCRKPRVKCRECKHREYLPLTDEVIWDHLDKNTETTIGIYPLSHDESCMFLAIDFDKKSWQDDVLVAKYASKMKFRLLWNGHDQEMGRMFGSFLKSPFLLPWHGIWAVVC